MRWQDLRWPQIDRLDRTMPVVIPLGSIEQHGHHLPVNTDTVQVDAIAEVVEVALQQQVIFLPTMWLGSSHHHLDFPGTISVSPTLYSQLITDVARGILRAGFRRVFFLNGHGGNETPLAQALTELSDTDTAAADALMAFASWWSVGKPEPAAHGMATSGISHACEYETSLMLHLRPQLVSTDHARDQCPVIDSRWLAGDKRVHLVRRFSRMTATGGLGSPTQASASKGASMLEAVAADVIAFLAEFSTWPLPRRLGPEASDERMDTA